MESFGEILVNEDKASADIKLTPHQANLAGINSLRTRREIKREEAGDRKRRIRLI